VKIKLDENIGTRGSKLLAKEGHDVSTVRMQGLSGSPDEKIFEICASEDRVLVTLDRDFGEVLRFPPDQSAGIVILELGPRASPRRLLDPLADFLSVAEEHDVRGSLWIVAKLDELRQKLATAEEEGGEYSLVEVRAFVHEQLRRRD
jgi:predicted nuclease of predicted toxin-antitoxin system